MSPSVGGGGALGSEDFTGEESDWGADQASATEKPETIHKAEEGCLLKDQTSELRFGVEGCVGHGVTARCEVVREGVQGGAILGIERCGMGDENGLVILRAARENGGDEGDAEAAALIAEKIREAGSFVVFVFRQVGIGELADGDEERRNTKTLQGSKKSDVSVVCTEIDARVTPHGKAEDDVAGENEGLDADFGKDFDNHGSENNDDHGARTEDEAGVGCGVAVKPLQHLRN